MKKINVEELRTLSIAAYLFIKNNNMYDLEEKRYELGNNVYVNVESYKTSHFWERRYESHKRYIDVQYVIRGRENIIVEPISNLFIDSEYNVDKDIVFYKNSVLGRNNILEAGDMLMLDSFDGHMPCISVDKCTFVKKAVFKIPIGQY